MGKLAKKNWAKPVALSFIKEVYVKSDKFDDSDLDRLDEVQALIKSSAVKLDTRNNRQSIVDSGIKSNPFEAGHQVVDARAERAVHGGAGTWAAK